MMPAIISMVDEIPEQRRRTSDFEKSAPSLFEWIGLNIGFGKILTGALAGILFLIIWYFGVNEMISKTKELSPVVDKAKTDIVSIQNDVTNIKKDLQSITERSNEIRTHMDKTLEQAAATRDKLMDVDNAAAVSAAKVIEHLNNVDIRLQGLENRMPPWQFSPPPTPGPRK
jgi:uncharacterized phage infection (PIP) family protein YhgE